MHFCTSGCTSAPLYMILCTLLCTCSAVPMHHQCSHTTSVHDPLQLAPAPLHLHLFTTSSAPSLPRLCTSVAPLQHLWSTCTSAAPLHLHCTTSALLHHLCTCTITTCTNQQSPLLNLSTYTAYKYQHLHFCICNSATLHLCTSAPLHLCTSSPLHLCTTAPTLCSAPALQHRCSTDSPVPTTSAPALHLLLCTTCSSAPPPPLPHLHTTSAPLQHL